MTVIVGAVLVGGASRRMGTDKALLAMEGSTMAHRVAAALVAGGATSIEVIGDDPAIARGLDLGDLVDGWGSRSDLWSGIGPLGGLATAVVEARPADSPQPLVLPSSIEAAIAAAASDDVIVVVAACDQPDLTGAVVRDLVGALQAADPAAGAAAIRSSDGRRHPFPSAWRATAGPALATAIAAGARRADAAFDVVRTIEITASAAVLADLDTPDDVARWRERGSGPGGSHPGNGATSP